ncbi:MAG: hypothetical protein AB7L66_18580 [Gemmatimonadales bacterium]
MPRRSTVRRGPAGAGGIAGHSAAAIGHRPVAAGIGRTPPKKR